MKIPFKSKTPKHKPIYSITRYSEKFDENFAGPCTAPFVHNKAITALK
jgi:hypothetical protein